MPKRYRVLPYRQGSKGAKALAEALGGKVLKIDGTGSYKYRPGDTIINWGSTQTSAFLGDQALNGIKNYVGLIQSVSNKLLFFQQMRAAGVDCIPDFWSNRDDIPDDAFPIVCRTVLAGHSGDGIVISASRDDLVAAPLYVKYIKKQDEYRVHVGRTEEPSGEVNGSPEEYVEVVNIIAVQRKARRLATEDVAVNWQVRNLAGGFVFTREGFTPPDLVLEAARHSLRASGLDFGAVDVIWNSHQGRAYVLEINTAPGLEGQTIRDYVNFFRGI